MGLVLRILFYIQLLLGLGRMFGKVSGSAWELHLGLGVIIAILAILVIKPLKDQSAAGLMIGARFLPLLTLVIGLLMYFGVAGGMMVISLHMLVGIMALGMVEAAIARTKRLGRGTA